MNEKKKEYSVAGIVTIGTDEYRDLITEKCDAEREVDRQRNEWYKEYARAQKLEEKNKKLTEKLDSIEKYLKENGEEDRFELWLLRISRGE